MNPPEHSASLWPVMPALAALLLCVGLTAYVVFAGTEPDVKALQSRATAATAAGQWSAAVLHQQHLLALEPNQPAHAFALGQSLDQLKRRPDAVAVLGTIAPSAGGGYPPAHLRLAEWAIESRVLGGTLDAAALNAALQNARAARADPALREQAATLIDILNGMTP